MAKITYNNKSNIITNPEIPAEAKVRDVDMNEIKSVVNENYDDLSTDYIIEAGSDDTWEWKKWKSGKVEILGFIQYTELVLTTSSMGTYYGSPKTASLPFVLTKTSYIGADETQTRSSGVYVYNKQINGDVLTTEFRAHASSNDAMCGVNYYIIGEF